ncbi:MAG: YbgC/FadM family acyl-CoA thioesterase [Elusimicrobia bacterium]|nr:YbgC/FadM family acyl-CoA thioesterase [Elusimicrobiota bacterium]
MAKTILIIDDDQSLVAPLREGLEAMGYRVAAAFDGLQGVQSARQVRPDLVILDFYMPGGGGAAVYERLRQGPDTALTPIVFSTVVSVEEVKGRIKPSAHTYFLRKPVGLGQLAALIRSVLGEAAAPSALEPQPPLLDRGAPQVSSPRVFDLPVRVTYADTDRMGVVYYANYLRFFEQGRTELLRGLGARYRDIETERGLFLPVAEASCRYAAPARYDDQIIVRTWVGALGKASVTFAYEVLDGEHRLASGRTRHAVVGEGWKPARLPDDLRAALSAYLGPAPEAP